MLEKVLLAKFPRKDRPCVEEESPAASRASQSQPESNSWPAALGALPAMLAPSQQGFEQDLMDGRGQLQMPGFKGTEGRSPSPRARQPRRALLVAFCPDLSSPQGLIEALITLGLRPGAERPRCIAGARVRVSCSHTCVGRGQRWLQLRKGQKTSSWELVCPGCHHQLSGDTPSFLGPLHSCSS